MNQISPRSRPLRLKALSTFLLTSCLFFPGAAYADDSGSQYASSSLAALQDACDLQFGASRLLGNKDEHPTVALHSSGLVLQFFRTPGRAEISYRVGLKIGDTVAWGSSQSSGRTGARPAVTISKEGYVILVNSDRDYNTASQQYYRVGTIDPYSTDLNQSITWKTESVHWDGGFNTSVAMNDSGVIVSVHQSNTGGTGLYYRVGQLRNPAGGDYMIAWTSGSNGVGYDNGMNPAITINNHNQIVEVHQVTGENLLHYRRGTVSGGQINFAESKRYDNHARQPAVALLDSGMVVEVHSLGGLFSRTGTLSLSNSTDIEWASPVKVDDDQTAVDPAVATNGTDAVQIHELDYKPELYFSTATICDTFRK
jgi:hypothetical protein